MKTKEMEQRPDNDLLVPCACGSNHYVRFSWSKYERANFKEFWVCLIDSKDGYLGHRIKSAFNHIFRGQDLYWGEVGINSKDIQKIKKMMDDYLSYDKEEENQNL